MTKKMNLAKVLTLSLLLAGMNTMYITPGAEAAVDATTTVLLKTLGWCTSTTMATATADTTGLVLFTTSTTSAVVATS